MEHKHQLIKHKIWMVLDHPMQLAIALAIAAHWSSRGFIINLLVSPHPYWSRVDIESYRNRFNDFFFLERPDYTWHPIRIIRWLFQIWRLKRRIARLNIRPEDAIVGLSIFHYLENIVLSMHPENLKIAIMPSVVYQECTREMDKSTYRDTLEGRVANWLVEPIMGLYRTYCMKERLYPNTYWRIRYRKSLLDIYDRVVVMGDVSGEEEPVGERIYTMPYPYVLALVDRLKNVSRASKQKVVFFGDFFAKGIWGIDPGEYVQHLNRCLSYLQTMYGSTHKLVYRPHPAESGEEMKHLNLDHFEIENDGMLSELYFFENLENIQAVFSVASTSSRSAFYCFINAYSFVDIFPFDSVARDYFKAEMGSVPDEFYIRELSVSPPKYIKTENIPSSILCCQKVLDMVLKKQ